MRSSEVAFTVVVVAAYAVLFTTYDYKIYDPQSLVWIVLGAIYLGIGLYGSRLLNDRENRAPWLLPAYLVFEIGLGTYINFQTNSGTWLLLMPLIGTAVENLPRLWVVGICSVIWLGQVIPLFLISGLALSVGWGMAYLSAVIFVAAFTQVAVNEQNARRELAAANQKLREYAAQIEELAVVQERNRMAREIHDGLGHYLTAINIQVKAAQAVSGQNPELVNEALANAQTLTQEALADVRRSISTLRADPSTSRPLPETLSRLLADTQAAGIQANFSVTGQVRPVPPQVEFTLYRVVQEGLTNVRKHAQASQVDLVLTYTEHAVLVRLKDDGIGTEQPGGGFGLLGLQERVQLVGGTLTVATHPGEGFMIEASIPV